MRRLLRLAQAASGIDVAPCEDGRVAPFRLGHDELQHELPWLLMQNGPVTKYWRREGFERDVAELQDRGFRVERFDAGAWADEDAMYCEMRDGLGLPSDTGMNFDALADSLEEMDVPVESGVVVALDNFTESRRTDAVLKALGAASRWWLLFGRLFIVVLRTDDPNYGGPDAIGAMPPQWNRREWFNADRQG